MLTAEVIKPAKIKWASHVLITPKTDGSIRLCVYYRKLATVKVNRSYYFSPIGECVDCLRDTKVFSSCNVNVGYWRIEINEDAKDMTAFDTRHELFLYKQKNFAPNILPKMFQRSMYVILATMKCRYDLVYLDDVVVFPQTPSQYFEHIATALRLMNSARLPLKLNKCLFFPDGINYLGHTIHPGTLEVTSKMTDAMQGFKPPTSLT